MLEVKGMQTSITLGRANAFFFWFSLFVPFFLDKFSISIARPYVLYNCADITQVRFGGSQKESHRAVF